MKAIALQFGKAMSAALFVLLLVVAGVKNALAQTQVATLQHGDEISAFYGTNAFVDAYSAAHAGDIVTLSGGSFTTPNTIFKAITLRGAGVVTDTVAGTIPTIFNSIINIRVNNDTIPLIVEGILFNQDVHLQNLINPSFTRCNFKKIDNANSNSGVVSNAQFINCIINSFSNNININTTFINSVIWQATSIRDEHRVSLYNSILSNSEYYIIGLSAYNSIFIVGELLLLQLVCFATVLELIILQMAIILLDKVTPRAVLITLHTQMCLRVSLAISHWRSLSY